MTRILLAIALISVLPACRSMLEDEFDRLAAQTESEIRLADRSGTLWRDTEKLLDDAKQANRDGRHDEALKLAAKALRQARLAQQQARDNAKAGPRYPGP